MTKSDMRKLTQALYYIGGGSLSEWAGQAEPIIQAAFDARDAAKDAEIKRLREVLDTFQRASQPAVGE